MYSGGGCGSGQVEIVDPSSGPSGHLLPASRGEGLWESVRPTNSVVRLPITAYQGQAIGVDRQTAVTAAMPASIPAKAAVDPSRFMADRRKTPRIGPLINEAPPGAVARA